MKNVFQLATTINKMKTRTLKLKVEVFETNPTYAKWQFRSQIYVRYEPNNDTTNEYTRRE